MSRRRRIMLSLLLGLSVLLALSRFYPEIEHLSVRGQQHYSEAEILSLAGLKPGTPFFWVTRWRAGNLTRDPWIQQARLERIWPDRVEVSVRERQPVASVGGVVYAGDATLLPGAEPSGELVRIEGWGEDRSKEALELLAYLHAFEPKVISYTPEGFDLKLKETELFTPDLATLKRHWSGLKQQVSGARQGDQIAIYPWGVSRTHD